MGIDWVVYFPNLDAANVVFDNNDTNDDGTDDSDSNEEYDAMLDQYDDYLERSNGYPVDGEEEYVNDGDDDFTVDSDCNMYYRQDLMAAGMWDEEHGCPKSYLLGIDENIEDKG